MFDFSERLSYFPGMTRSTFPAYFVLKPARPKDKFASSIVEVLDIAWCLV